MCDSFGLELRSNSEGLNPESPRTLHPHTVWSDISHGLSRCEGKGKSRRREEEGKGEVLLGRVNILETFSTLFKVKHGSLNANFLSGALSFHNRSKFFWIWSNIYRTYFFLTEIPCIIWELSDVGGWLWDCYLEILIYGVKSICQTTIAIQNSFSTQKRDIFCFFSLKSVLIRVFFKK